MTGTQWLGVLISLPVLGRVFSGIWMHTHPTNDDPSRALRGWKGLWAIPLLILFGDGWPNRGSPGRVPAVVYHWLWTTFFAIFAFFMLRIDPL